MSSTEVEPTFTKKEAKAIAREVAQDTIEQYENHGEDQDFEEEQLANALPPTEDEVQYEAEEEDAFDIFESVGEVYSKKGIFCKYVIEKHGELLCNQKHPYSWEQLHQEYGGGHYKVVCKNQRGKYIKSSVKYLADVPKKVEEDEGQGKTLSFVANLQESIRIDSERRDREMKEERQKMLEEAKEKEERFRSEQKELTEQVNDSKRQSDDRIIALISAMNGNKSDNLTPLITQMNQSNSDNMKMMLALIESNRPQKDDSVDKLTQLMMNMNDKTLQIIEKINEKNDQKIEKMNDSMNTMFKEVSNSNKDNKEMSPLELLKFYKEAENDGYEKRSTIEEMATLKAEEKSQGGDDGDSSIQNSLIKHAVPALANMFQASVQAKQQTAQPRRLLSQPNTRKRLSQAQVSSNDPKKRRETKQSQSPSRESSTKNSGGLMIVGKKSNQDLTHDTDKISNSANKELKTKVIDLIAGVVGTGLIEQKEPKLVATACLSYLNDEHNIEKSLIHGLFTYQDLLDLAEKYDIFNEQTDENCTWIKNWLKDYYDKIQVYSKESSRPA